MYEELSKKLIAEWRRKYENHENGKPTLRETIGTLKSIYRMNNQDKPAHIINIMIMDDMGLGDVFKDLFSRRPDAIKLFFKAESKEEVEETQKLLTINKK